MKTIAYEGYFDNGQFYSAGKAVKLPEQRRMVIALLENPHTIEVDRNIGVPTDSKLKFDFVKDVPPLPDSFFEPLSEEELELWNL